MTQSLKEINRMLRNELSKHKAVRDENKVKVLRNKKAKTLSSVQTVKSKLFGMNDTIPDNSEVIYSKIIPEEGELFVELQQENRVLHQRYNLVQISETVAYQTPNMKEDNS